MPVIASLLTQTSSKCTLKMISGKFNNIKNGDRLQRHCECSAVIQSKVSSAMPPFVSNLDLLLQMSFT